MKKSCAVIAALLVLTSCSKPPENKDTTVPESKLETTTKSVQQVNTVSAKDENTSNENINNQQNNESFYWGQYQMADEGFSQHIKNNAIDRDYQIESDKFQASPEFSTQGWVELEYKYVEIWDKELNDIYKKLLDRLNDEEQEKLRKAQRGWLQFHINESEFVHEAWNDLGLGSQGRVQLAMLIKERIRNRTLQLMEYYYMMGGEVEFLYKGDKNGY